MKKNALLKYLSALLLFGLNGIFASQIAMNSYEIVFLRTLIGSILLIAIFLLTKGKFRLKTNRKDYLFILLSGVAMGASWMFLYEAYQQIGVGVASLLCCLCRQLLSADIWNHCRQLSLLPCSCMKKCHSCKSSVQFASLAEP